MEELEGELLEVNSNSERLQRSYAELVELQLVLEKAGSFFDQARVEAQAENMDRSYSVPEDMGAPLLESALPVGDASGPAWMRQWVEGYPTHMPPTCLDEVNKQNGMLLQWKRVTLGKDQCSQHKRLVALRCSLPVGWPLS